MPAAKSKQTLEAGRRARVLVVDDSSVMRRLVTLVLQGDPCLQVVGVARNGRDALEKLVTLRPDAVTLDIDMPEMNGLEALRHIRQLLPQVRVVMLSTLTERGAAATLEALTLGADDYATKPSAGKSLGDSTLKLRAELTPKIKQFFTFLGSVASNPVVADTGLPGGYETPARAAPVARVDNRRAKADPVGRPESNAARIVVIGTSTGGPPALARLLPAIPKDFLLPVLIVQHMPAVFTRTLCQRLQEHLQVGIHEAEQNEVVQPGSVLLAPGDYHMRLQLVQGERQPRIRLDQGPPQNSCRPAVDALFESAAEVYGGAVVAAVLTGMGQDGLRGATLLKQAGATIIAQDEETSAVWGMPRAIVRANLADAVLPLAEIMPQILSYCGQAESADDTGLRRTHK